MPATLLLSSDGRILDASPEALRLLDISLEDARALPPDSFAAEPPDPEADAAFKAQWEAEGQPDLGGQATLRRLDGSKVRVRFAISATGDDGYLAVLEPIDGPVEAPPLVYSGGRILSEWRAAERRLAEVEPETDIWRDIQAEIERLRGLYQGLFAR